MTNIEKHYKSYEERIQILTDRNMTINKRSSIHRNLMNNYNYYNIINGYKDLFLENNNQEKYKTGSSPDQLFALYKFDERLRIILLEFLLPIEEKLKHEISQCFHEYFINDINTTKYDKDRLHREAIYQKREFYDLRNKRQERTFSKYIEISQSEIATQYRKGNNSIQNYKDSHQYIPMWVLFNILTFGNMSKLFTILKLDIKIQVMKKMGIYWDFPNQRNTIDQFEKTLEILTLARNRCAHSERLYTFSHTMPLKDNFLDFKSVLPKPNDTLNYPNRSEMKFGIFSVIFLIYRLSIPKDSKKMIKMIKRELAKLEKSLVTITKDDVLKLMNMNHDWEELL